MADFPAAVPSLPPLVPYTQDQLLALFDRLLPDHYLAPLKDPGPGYEYLQAVAKMMARASEAVAHVGSGSYIGSATGGSYATVTVELFRDSDTFGAVTLLGRESAPQGTLVGTADGYYYQLMTDVNFGATELGPKEVEAQAVVRGWAWNRPGPFYTLDGEFVPGSINQLVRPVFPTSPTPPNFDPTIQVRQKYKGASVTLSRPTADAGAVTIPAGTVITTDTGTQFVWLTDAVFGATDLGPVTVTMRPMDPLKTSGTSFGAGGIWPADYSIQIDSCVPWEPSDAAGGSSPMLDGLGLDRGIARNFAGITSVQLGRSDTTDTVIVMPGSVLSTVDGYHYETTSIVTFPAGEAGPFLVSVLPLFLNVPANIAPINTVVSIVWGSAATDGSIYVASSPTPQIEPDEAYRTRIAFLPKTVTPNAIREALHGTLDNLLTQVGKTWDYREVWDIRYQSAYDFPFTLGVPTYLDYANLNVPVPAFNAAVFVYDYVPLNEALSNRYLSASPERGTVVIKLPPLTSPAQSNADVYPGLAANLEQIKPAGANVLYVLAD